MLQLDQKFITELESSAVEKIKVFFYSAGCSGTKINIETDFEVTEDLVQLPPISTSGKSSPLDGDGLEGSILVYVPKRDKEHLENARITRTVKADHTGQEKIRFIFTSEEVEDRCGCGTSFAFEKKTPKVDLAKLAELRKNFIKKQT